MAAVTDDPAKVIAAQLAIRLTNVISRTVEREARKMIEATVKGVLAANAAPPAEVAANAPVQVTDDFLNDWWQSFLDKDDRNSPEEYPEMILVTFEEMKEFALEAALAASSPAPSWRTIESAPKGYPSSDAGCRDESEWFLGLRKDKRVIQIRRRCWPHEVDWRDIDDTHYSTEWFTHWQPLPEPPATPESKAVDTGETGR